MDEATEQAADRLYAVPPGQFVAERTAAVAAARAAGDRAGAAALAKLRRPSVAAWLVNLLALRRPELVNELAELARALQAAQRRLDGAQLRALASERRATVAALVAQVRALAQEADPGLAAAKLPLAEVEATLHAALADPEVAAQLRAGRLVRPATPAGFGEATGQPPQLQLIDGGAGTGGDGGAVDRSAGSAGAEAGQAPRETQAGQARRETSAGQARREAEAALGAARADASRASAALDECGSEQQAAQQELVQIDAALDELMARRTEVAERLATAEQASFQARRAVAQARKRVAEAEAALAELDPAD